MAKKYLSIEEAAAQIGVNATELNRLREKGMIRAFADRGTWKFKEEDVEKLLRSREADSNPDVTINLSPVDNSTVNLPAVEDSADASVIDDEDVLAEQPTIVRKSPSEESSDSDVRLIFDDAMKVEGTAVPPLLADSDSDVKLAGPPAGASSDDSDSDVKLAGPPAGASSDDSDSDVKLAGSKEGILNPGSDSDVKLVMDDIPLKDPTGSDSDVRLVSSDSSGEVKLAGTSHDSLSIADSADLSIGEATDDGGSVMEEDSGISLAEGSGLSLASDSGISLESPNDSGISLSGESDLVLSADSGISLAGDGSFKSDSGISLAPQTASDKKKKKPAQPDSEDLSGTVPLMDVPLAEGDDLLDTHMEVPSLEDSHGSGDDLFGDDEGSTANVVTLDDEEEQSYDVTANIPTTGGAALDDSEEEIVAEEDEEPVEVSDDLVGEDDELAEDVFGAEDDDFADEVESGESSYELPVASPRGMVAAEQDWGMPTHVMLWVSTALSVACGLVLFDMVRNMWHTDAANHNPIASMLLDMFKSI